MKIDKDTVKKMFARIEVKADIKVDKSTEVTSKDYPIEIRVRRDKNKELYRLRDFFACKTDPKIKLRSYRFVNEERYLYRSYFVNILKKIYSNPDMFLASEIVFYCTDITDISSFNANINGLVSSMAQAYNVLLNEKTITMTYVSSEGGENI